MPNTFVAGEVISASKMNENFKKLFDSLGITDAGGLSVNGNIDATGLSINGTAVGTSSGSFWSDAGSNRITYNSGNVGIGITPTVPLHVSGAITSTGTITANAFSGNGSSITNAAWNNVSGKPTELSSADNYITPSGAVMSFDLAWTLPRLT